MITKSYREQQTVDFFDPFGIIPVVRGKGDDTSTGRTQ
jgi:hypothetical protein